MIAVPQPAARPHRPGVGYGARRSRRSRPLARLGRRRRPTPARPPQSDPRSGAPRDGALLGRTRRRRRHLWIRSARRWTSAWLIRVRARLHALRPQRFRGGRPRAVSDSAEVDRTFGDVIATAHGQRQRVAYPTPHLARERRRLRQPLGGAKVIPARVASRSLSPHPARRSRFFRRDSGGRRSGLEPRIADLLLGVNRLDETVRRVIEPVEPGPLSGAHRDEVNSVVADLRPLLQPDRVRAQPRRRLGIRPARLRRNGVRDARVRPVRVRPRGASRRRAERELAPRPSTATPSCLRSPCMSTHRATPDDPRILADVLRDRECFLITGSAAGLSLHPGDVTVEVAGP